MKLSQADPMQPKITGMFSATVKEKKQTKKTKGKKSRKIGDESEKKRKERDDAWSDEDKELFGDKMEPMDIDEEDDRSKMKMDKDDDSENPLDRWLEDKQNLDDLANTNDEEEEQEEKEEHSR